MLLRYCVKPSKLHVSVVCVCVQKYVHKGTKCETLGLGLGSGVVLGMVLGLGLVSVLGSYGETFSQYGYFSRYPEYHNTDKNVVMIRNTYVCMWSNE